MSATIPVDWIPACTEAMGEMLESMFFETLLDAPVEETNPPADAIWVSVDYRGALAGRVWVGVAAPVADRLLANFLGREDEEPATSAEQGMVTCELANMLCGCMLSRVDPENRLDIAAPQLADGSGPVDRCLSFPLENGHIYVNMEA